MGFRVLLADPPAGFPEQLAAAAPDVEFRDLAAARADWPHDAAMWWPTRADAFGERLDRLSRRIRVDGALWVVMPKKALAASFGVGLTWDEMQRAALASGDFVDTKTVSLGPTHYATRFVVRANRRKARGG